MGSRIEIKRSRFRDRTHMKCYWCKRKLSFNMATMDHYKPKCLFSTGERHRGKNLVICCGSCNSIRSVLTYTLYIQNFTNNVNDLALIKKIERWVRQYLWKDKWHKAYKSEIKTWITKQKKKHRKSFEDGHLIRDEKLSEIR